MPKLTIELENCYGIKKLSAAFDFQVARAYAIYAPNGAMKSSLATTFQDIADNKPSKDRIFADRKAVREILLDEKDLDKDSVLVVRPYDEVFGNSEKTSTLLVNAKLRSEYEALQEEVVKAEDELISALKAQSGSKKDIRQEVSATFTQTDTDFSKALLRIEGEVLAQKAAPFADVKYDIVFDQKVLDLLETKDVKNAIKDYITKYNELLAKSTYFKKGIFNYYNAASIAKSLADHGFFKAKHSINLVAGARLEISDEKQLAELIKKEKEGITSDAALRKKFAEVEKAIERNVTVRDFQSYIEEREDVLANLSNIGAFKEEVWKSYLHANLEVYKNLISKYRAVEKRKTEIETQAAAERTRWEETIEIFNQRFFVPFALVAKNKVPVMLGDEPILNLGFTFIDDSGEKASVDYGALIGVLSTGEKKALYILNIIFEIEARRASNQKTVLIIDDIADSFDYRNKYAIIQYLKDIAEDDTFNQIILTHNFDFFRTINGRFVDYNYCYMASKDAGGLTLSKAAGIRNIFVNDWKGAFCKDPKKRIASIPFMRNLIEFTKGDSDPDYDGLTSLLHWKIKTPGITQSELGDIYNRLFGATVKLDDEKRAVVDLVFELADECLKAGAGTNFENKVVLSVATRLKAEKFMATKIADQKFLEAVKANQTPELLKEYRKRFPSDAVNMAVIDRVLVMTPENIHLNSFMYEPIIDMSDEHLRRLYKDVCALTG